jgi:hypothetical protein
MLRSVTTSSLWEWVLFQELQVMGTCLLHVFAGTALQPIAVIAAKVDLLNLRELHPGIAEGAQCGLGPGQIGRHGFNLPRRPSTLLFHSYVFQLLYRSLLLFFCCILLHTLVILLPGPGDEGKRLCRKEPCRCLDYH